MSLEINSNLTFHSVFNVSSLDVAENNGTTESSTWDIREITRIVHVVVRPFLVVFGTIGNALSFYIMRKSSLKKLSTCFYMSILSLADTGESFACSESSTCSE